MIDRSLVELDVNVSANARLWAVFNRDVGEMARVRAVIEWLKKSCDNKISPWFSEDFIHPAELFDMTRE